MGDEAVNSGLTEGRGQAEKQKGSKTLTKAQINVVTTMIYITVGFTVCWMPVYLLFMFMAIMVRNIAYIKSSII